MSLATTYLGLPLAHPFIAGASPLAHHLDRLRQLEEGGASAVVLHSLFEEQITFHHHGEIRHRDPLDPQFADALSAFPSGDAYALGPDAYLEHLRQAKAALGIPVIASLNGTSNESWARFAVQMQQAGADALELNIYDVVSSPQRSAMSVETELRDLILELKRAVRIPIAVKLSPFYTALGNLAKRLDDAGADGLVLFNRFYQPDVDLATQQVVLRLVFSTAQELPLRLQWTALLHGRITASLAVAGGVWSADDGIKALLAGADAVQVVSAVLKHGPAHLSTLRDGLARWMEAHAITSVADLRGRASFRTTADPSAVQRASYIRTLQSWTIPADYFPRPS